MKQALSITVALGILAATNLCAQSGAADRPQVKVGDTWSFRTVNLLTNEETQTYEMRVTEVSGDNLTLVRTVRSAKTESDVGKQTTLKADASTWTFENPVVREGKYIAFLFPLDVGKTWEYEWKWNNSSGGGLGSTKVNAKVEGWEDVSTPAGTFKALKVVHDGTWSGTFTGYNVSGLQQETLWYVPELKWWVKREYSRRSAYPNRITDSTRSELISRELVR